MKIQQKGRMWLCLLSYRGERIICQDLEIGYCKKEEIWYNQYQWERF